MTAVEQALEDDKRRLFEVIAENEKEVERLRNSVHRALWLVDNGFQLHMHQWDDWQDEASEIMKGHYP